ncbi:MAG: aromatic ring-hydroxylating dioxygenase subunit alpha [Nannocystaceae bacterium]
MFDGFARVWTPIALASELRPGQLLPTEVAGVRLVLFRDPGGAPRALVDRCPHRGVALSLGRIADDGCVECPFHGWRFRGDGEASKVPWNPDARLGPLAAQAVPACERGGILWIYTAPGLTAPSEPEPPAEYLRPGVRICGESLEWRTHWTRAMENMLDWPHLPFVHEATIGRGMLRRGDARMDVQIEPRPYGAHTTITIDGEAQRGALDLRWPNVMVLQAPIRSWTMVMMVACVPIDGARTRMLLLTARDFLTWSALDGAFRRANRRIAGEDRAIVESSDPPEVPPARDERSVRTDALPLLFRKRYFAELKGSSASAELRAIRPRAERGEPTSAGPSAA